MPVKLNDYSINVKAELNDITKQWLHLAGFEVEAEVKRNCVMDDKGTLKGSYRSVVDEGKGETLVGSPLESVYWEEFGTGSHAAHGDGRKGWWVYVKNGESRNKTSQTYASQAEAEEAAEFLRKVKHLDAHATNGRDPNYTIEKSFKNKSSSVQRLLENMLKGGMG